MKGAFQPMNEYKQTWVFQANPTVWHSFHEYFKQQMVGATSDWTVSRYRKKMQPGDRVLLWEAGSRGGLLAIGELTEEPFQQEPSTEQSDEQVNPVWKVRFQYTHFLEEPIQRSTFKKTKVLQDMLHIRVPQGSNFKVTEEEWKVLQKLINITLEKDGEGGSMKTISIATKKKDQIVDITETIETHLRDAQDEEGICVLFIAHTTCAITTADLDPGTDLDFLDALRRLLPQIHYRHPHDPAHAPDHILSAIIGPSLTLPYRNRQLLLGMWQRVVLVELDGPRQRTLHISFI